MQVQHLQSALHLCQPLSSIIPLLHQHTFLLYFAYAYVAPAQPALQVQQVTHHTSHVTRHASHVTRHASHDIQGIDSSSSAPSIAYSRSAWLQLVACHTELSRDPSLVSRKALLRCVRLMF